jgi:hypothetical protein
MFLLLGLSHDVDRDACQLRRRAVRESITSDGDLLACRLSRNEQARKQEFCVARQ